MPSTAVPSSPDENAPLVLKRLPRPRRLLGLASDISPPVKLRNPPPVVKPKVGFRNHPLLDLQAREDKNGRSVSGSDNSSDDADATDLSYVSPSADHSNAEKHEYLASLQSQNGFPTPIHKGRHSDLVYDGIRDSLIDDLYQREQAKMLARATLKASDPIAYAARKAMLARAKSEREAAREARRLSKLNAGNETPALAKIASRPASKPVHQLPQAPKQDTVLLALDSPSSNRGRSPTVASPKVIPEVIHVTVASPKVISEVIDVSSASKPPTSPRLPLQQPQLHKFFKPFHRAAAATFTLTHEIKFHAVVRNNSLTSPTKLVEELQPTSPLLDPPLLAPQVLFPTVGSNLQHMLSPVAVPASLPLVRSHRSPNVQHSLSTTFSDMSVAKKKPNLQPSPTSHESDLCAKKYLHPRLRLKRTQPLFCSGCFVEMCADVFNAAVQTSPRISREQAFSAAPVTAAVQTSPRNAIELPLTVAVQTSPRFTQKQSFDKPTQTSPRDDPDRPVTVQDLRSAIREMLVGLGLCLQ
jgi:hypothetical protein